jgi:branched-chain amino acid aminotransferase
VSFNGRILLPEEAVISVFDRGFLYGDSVYEVVRTYGGVPFELEAHLERLEASALRIGMRLPVSLEQIATEILATNAASELPDAYVRVVITRGAGEIGLDPALAVDPVRLVYSMPLKTPPPEVYEKGVRLALVSVRRNLRSAVDPAAKTGNYLNSVLAVSEARAKNAFEAVMLDHRDFITEGASSNIFAVIGGSLFTPPLEVGILKGVTRTVVFQVAEKLGVRTIEAPMTEAMLKQAEEVFITSTIREIVPVVEVDDLPIGTGAVGPVVKQIRAGFRDYVETYSAERASTLLIT